MTTPGPHRGRTQQGRVNEADHSLPDEREHRHVREPRLQAQDAPGPTDKKIAYSPYPAKNFPSRVYFGDTHLHTSYSTDAGMIGNTLGPEEAYRFARGEEVKSSSGLPAKLQRPLDFLVVPITRRTLVLRRSSPARTRSS
jgi:hypothetical protein